MKKIGVDVYTINELSESVRAKVIEKCRYDDCDIANEAIKDNFEITLGLKGYPVDDIRWSLSDSQGDGVAFYGEIDLQDFMEKRREELEECLDKHMLRRLKYIIGEGLEIKIQKSSYFHHYDHYNTMIVYTVDCADCYMHENAKEKDIENMVDAVYELVEFIKHDVKVVSQELESEGYDIIDSYTSDEYIIDSLETNEVYFTNDGKYVNADAYEEIV